MLNFKRVLATAAPATMFAFALVVAFVSGVDTSHAQTVYDFASTTQEAAALQNGLKSQAFVIIFAALAALLPIALAVLGAGFVWRKFKKLTGMSKGI